MNKKPEYFQNLNGKLDQWIQDLEKKPVYNFLKIKKIIDNHDIEIEIMHKNDKVKPFFKIVTTKMGINLDNIMQQCSMSITEHGKTKTYEFSNRKRPDDQVIGFHGNNDFQNANGNPVLQATHSDKDKEVFQKVFMTIINNHIENFTNLNLSVILKNQAVNQIKSTQVLNNKSLKP